VSFPVDVPNTWSHSVNWCLLLTQATPTPSQFTLESKFLQGQPLYRFTLASEEDFIIDLRPQSRLLDHSFQLISLTNGNAWDVCRRPLMHTLLP